jgi:glycosyltransferase involved in cell wall biosynthesis
MKNILFLYSRLNGFVVSTAASLARSLPNSKVTIVYWDNAEEIGNKFSIDNQDSVILIKRSQHNYLSLKKMVTEISPELIYLSGWMDPEYIKTVENLRRKGQIFTTVCGIDDQWFGSIRQYIGSLYFRIYYKSIYDYMWVAGKPQYHYARMMGYTPEKIISNLLSADSEKFQIATGRQKRFVFFGRFDRIKGIDTLIAAYKSLPDAHRAAWPLVLIGDGEMRYLVEREVSEQISFIPYLQPDELARELSLGGVGMLTSTFEAWSVALHEMTLMGYPVIVSRQCGAASEFLIHGYNGFLFDGGDVASLATAMHAMIALTDDARADMGRASIVLANRITPEISARSLLSLLATPPKPK